MTSTAIASASGPNGTDYDYSYSEDGKATASASSTGGSTSAKTSSWGSTNTRGPEDMMGSMYARKHNMEGPDQMIGRMVEHLGQLFERFGIDADIAGRFAQALTEAFGAAKSANEKKDVNPNQIIEVIIQKLQELIANVRQ